MKPDDELTIDLRKAKRTLYSKGRFMVTPSGYVFDRRLFRMFSIIFILFCAYLFYTAGGLKTYAYASCPDDALGGYCVNPAYGKCDLPACERELLLPGEEIGEKPPDYFGGFALMMLLLGALFGVNHISQNNKEFKEARKNARNTNKSVNRKRNTSVKKARKRQKQKLG